MSKLQKLGLSKQTAEAITKEYWTELNGIDDRFSKEGIRNVAAAKFLPIVEIMDKLDLIKDAITKAVLNIRRSFEDESNGIES